MGNTRKAVRKRTTSSGRSATFGLKGWVRPSVVDHFGNTIRQGEKQRNLLLDSGMDKIASLPICDLFLTCAKGDGTTPTSEDVADSNTYSQSSGTVTRTAGTRDFTADDVGKLILTENALQARITVFTSTVQVDVDRIQSFTNKNIVLYSVQQTALDNELARTDEYSSVANENSTTTGGGATKAERTFKRTFVFAAEDEIKEVVTGTYSRAGTTVTRATGSRDFTTDDVGKNLYFVTDDLVVKITAFTNATNVTVDSAGVIAAQNIELYGFNTYTEVGFSDSSVANDPLNIRVLLDTPVVVEGPTPDVPGQQLKVTYEMKLTISPVAEVSGAAPISDPSNAMSSAKGGKQIIESYATSQVMRDGATDTSFPNLEPYYEGSAALSPKLADLKTDLSAPDFSDGAAIVPLVADPYVPGGVDGLYFKTFLATFGINDGVANNNRSLLIIDEDSGASIFRFLFNNNQVKDGTHVLTVTFKKSWDRMLT